MVRTYWSETLQRRVTVPDTSAHARRIAELEAKLDNMTRAIMMLDANGRTEAAALLDAKRAKIMEALRVC
jgi:hypothetical protein